MIDLFLILTPFLLLGVIALLGFVGCNQVFGIQETIEAMTVNSVTPQSGSTQGGTRVRITGSNFDSHATVTFDGLAATEIDVSGSVINCTTPGPHASGAVDITVTNPDGNTGTLPATDPGHFSYAAVTNIGQTLIVPGFNNAGGAMAQASVAFSDTPKLVVVTVVWPTGGGTLASLTITGGSFQPPLKVDLWSGYNVQTSYAAGVPPGTNVAVTAILSSPTTPSPWHLCVTVYDNADQTSPAYAPNSLNSVSSSTIIPVTINALDASDLIYAVAIAQTAGGSFAGFTGKLSAGPMFTEEQNAGYLLIEDFQTTAAGPVQVGADTTGTNTGRWYLLAVGVKHF
ncbi:MAG TPA: IPT/TIG domain-containing protein [Terriglobales bacterium]|nr:IPT/TIG domain-containing protein [Terriglobales bacterium]